MDFVDTKEPDTKKSLGYYVAVYLWEHIRGQD